MSPAALTERDGFRDFYLANHRRVGTWLQRKGVPQGAVEDATQDVFVIAYRKAHTARGDALQAWLRGIVRGVAANYRRRNTRVERKHEAWRTSALTWQQTAAGHLDLDAIARFVDALPTRDRELFLRSEVEGYTARELQASLGIPPSTLYSRMQTLRRRLAKALDATRERAWLAMGGWSWGWAAVSIATVFMLSASKHDDEDDYSLPTPTSSARSIPVVDVPESAAPMRVQAATASVPADPPRKRATAVKRSGRRHRAPTVSKGEPQSRLTEELAGLRHAETTLRTRGPSSAHKELGLHRQQFPKSSFADLRDAIEIDISCALGRTELALEQVAAFRSTHAGSSAGVRVEKSCGAS